MECSCCGEEVPRLLDPPVVRIPRSQLPRFDEGDAAVDWHAPGQAFPGTDAYDVLRFDEMAVYAMPYECRDDWRLCYVCYVGHTIPAIVNYLDNKPRELKFNGWRQPEWIEQHP